MLDRLKSPSLAYDSGGGREPSPVRVSYFDPRTGEPIPRRDESGKPTFNCSECGTAIGGLRGSDKYCHECGAKVMRK